MAKTRFSFFSYDTETTPDTKPHQVLYSSCKYCCRCSLQQAHRSYSYKKEKGDAARIEPPQPSPSTRRLCARSSRTLFRPHASGDDTRMPSVLGESRASCRLSMRQDQTQAHSNSSSTSIFELPARARRQTISSCS